MQNIKLIVFDLDGTLDLAGAAEYICHKHNSDIKVSDSVAKKCIGNGLRVYLDRIFKSYSINPTDFENDLYEMKQYYFNNACVNTKLYEDTVQTLSYIKEKGIHMVIATMKPLIPAKKILEHFGISEYFEMVIAGDVMPEPKPSAKIMDIFINNYNLDPKEILVVGDGMTDVNMATNSGAYSVALLDGYGNKEILGNSSADYKFSNLNQIISIL